MHFRFSLRRLLIVFTVIALLLGAGANLFFRPFFRIRRHQIAVNKLHEMGDRIRIAGSGSDNAEPSIFVEAIWREWTAKEDFPRISEFWQGDLSKRITSKEAEAALTLLQDLRNVPAIRMNVDRVTPKIVELIAQFPKCADLELQFAKLDSGTGKSLSKLRQVQSLTLNGPLNDEGVIALGSLLALRNLSVEATGVSNEALASLSKAPNLVLLTLRGSINGAELFEALADHENIYEVDLSGVTLNEIAAESFSSLKHVRNIELSGDCCFPESWWRSVARLPRLEKVSIRDSPKTSKLGLESLTNSVTLNTLEMESITLTAAQLQSLEGHPGLKELTFCGVLSQEEIRRFLSVTPDCRLSLVQPLDPDSGVGPTGLNGTTYYLFKGEVTQRPWPELICGGCWFPFTP